MDDSIVKRIERLIAISDSHFRKYAALVNDLEFVAEQYTSVFTTAGVTARYNEIWMELEIINACALCEWEELGKPENFNEIWTKKYRNDARCVLSEMIDFLKTEVGEKQ